MSAELARVLDALRQHDLLAWTPPRLPLLPALTGIVGDSVPLRIVVPAALEDRAQPQALLSAVRTPAP